MFKKMLSIIMFLMIMSYMLFSFKEKAAFASINVAEKRPVRVAVFLINFSDDYISLVRKDLEDIQEENPGKVEFTFYDAKSNQAVQNEQLDNVLKEGVDLIIMHLVKNRDELTVKRVTNQIAKANIPVIFFNREPLLSEIKRYNKSLYIGLDAKSDGTMEGEILANEWNTNRDSIDKNHDGIMQYVLLEGERNNLVAADRTKYSLLALSEAGVETQELERVFAYWSRELAKEAIESLFLKTGPKIEAIIANDDSMALGAIEALQSYGYNLGDKEKNIAVVGVEGLPESQKLINEGLMLGTIFQDPKAMAEALYTIGMNMVKGRDPIEGTDYQFDQTGVAIRIPNKIIYKK